MPSLDASVATLARSHFVTVRPDESALEADRVMRMARLRQLPVVEDGVLLGMLWNTDLLEQWIARLSVAPVEEVNEEMRRLPVSRLMREQTWTCTPDQTLRSAAEGMLSGEVGCLPVIEKDESGARIVGLITERDLLRAAYGH
jgi:acetoin utilization protein AcuB